MFICRNKCFFRMKCLKVCILNFKNCLMFIFANFRKIINQTTIFFDLSEYSDNNIFSFSVVIRTNAIRTQFISTSMKSTISISFASSISFEAVRKRRESLSTISYFVFNTCWISKWKKTKLNQSSKDENFW